MIRFPLLLPSMNQLWSIAYFYEFCGEYWVTPPLFLCWCACSLQRFAAWAFVLASTFAHDSSTKICQIRHFQSCVGRWTREPHANFILLDCVKSTWYDRKRALRLRLEMQIQISWTKWSKTWTKRRWEGRWLLCVRVYRNRRILSRNFRCYQCCINLDWLTRWMFWRHLRRSVYTLSIHQKSKVMLQGRLLR